MPPLSQRPVAASPATPSAPAPFIALSFAAGSLDAISFVALGSVFTANMTGNTVLLGIALAARLGAVPGSLGIAPPLLSIGAFVVGVALAMPVLGRTFDARRAAAIVAGEAALVAASAALLTRGVSGAVPESIALVSFVMGAQSVVAARAGLPGISTTYVTGTLVAATLRGLEPGADRARKREARHDAYAWGAYLAGSAAGALLFLALRRAALWPPAALLACLALWIARARPRR